MIKFLNIFTVVAFKIILWGIIFLIGYYFGYKQKDFDCKHNWIVIAETQALPTMKYEFLRAEYELREKITFGYTTILWECSNCKKTKKEEMLGIKK